MGLFEKRRFRNFLCWVQDFQEADPKTWKDLSPTSTMDEVYKKFGLDENTCDFVGHALALYRDDMILVTLKHGKTINSIKSILIKMFKKENLVLCEWEEGEVQNYLDVEFNLRMNTYKPFKKDNDSTKYL